MMQACHPHLKARGGGSIVNFASSISVRGTAGFASYAITKEARRGLTRVAAQEWGLVARVDDDLCFLTGATLMLDGGANVIN